MVQIRHILCPIDFSDTSRHALEHAVTIAKWYRATLTAFHAIPLAMPQPPIFFAAVVDPTVPSASDRQAREEQLRLWLAPAREAGIETNVCVEEGNAAVRIVAQVASSHPDLLVMGTHGLSGFDRFMLGSVTEKVLRKSTCPVLTIPPTAATSATIPYARLLCPVDFSESSLAALRFACSLAKESGGTLTVFHVFDWPEREPPELVRVDAERMRQYLEADATTRLNALVADDVKTWCAVSTRTTHGKPYRQILDVAQHDAVDVIVMGVHGRHPVDMMLFGSTTNHVVRRAPCPVLTVKG